MQRSVSWLPAPVHEGKEEKLAEMVFDSDSLGRIADVPSCCHSRNSQIISVSGTESRGSDDRREKVTL